MARKIIVHETQEQGELRPSAERMSSLETWLYHELEDAFASRAAMESLWIDLLRQYEGIPKNPVKNYPIENAPNIEITLGAIAGDSIFAQAMDLKWSQTSPLVTVRPVGNKQEDQDNARALQRFANWVPNNQAGAREADEVATLDTVQLGTSIFYIPWAHTVKKTKVSQVITEGPKIHCIPPEDFIIPGGSFGDLEEITWMGLRFWYTEGEFREKAKKNKWKIEGAESAPTQGWVRNRREIVARDEGAMKRKVNLFDVFDIYCYYDIDECGVREDLLVTYNHTGRKILNITYNPFDCRPVAGVRYQVRPHMFWGLGVLEMMRPFQAEVTDIHNERNANMLLANCRHWVGRDGAISGNMKLRPNKVTLVPEPMTDLKELRMADIYPSSYQAETMTMMLAEKRVGVNEMSSPRPSAIMGSRTPGITALTMMQQVNRRFTPAFDAMRKGLSESVKQCIYRYQEKILSNRPDVEEFIVSLLGEKDGARVISILGNPNFDEAYTMELTASSTSVNREADRQNAVMLVNVLTQYYERALQLVTIASNPQTPPPVQKVAMQIAEKAGEIISRTVTTFDQMRDPATFIVNFNEEVDQIQGMAPEGLQGLSQMMGGMNGMNGLQEIPEEDEMIPTEPLPIGPPIEE